jgi:hypothetical protein
MAKPRVRYSDLKFAQSLVEAGLDLDECEPEPNGVHSKRSICASLHRQLFGERVAAQRRTPAMTVAAAYATGRLPPDRQKYWQDRFDADPVGTGDTLASMDPVFAEEREAERRGVAAASYRAGSTSDTPLLDEMEEALYGPSREVRERREDLAAEAALRQQFEDERRGVEASAALTDDEYRALFGE